MRTPTPPHLLVDVVEETEELARRAGHNVAHLAERTVDAVLSPFTVDIELDGLTADELEQWD